jgi:hypothetical protein
MSVHDQHNFVGSLPALSILEGYAQIVTFWHIDYSMYQTQRLHSKSLEGASSVDRTVIECTYNLQRVPK